MNQLKKLYKRSAMYPVCNLVTEDGRGRTNLMLSTIMLSIVNGFTGGIFYTGFLVSYGINIVNISILTLLPSVCGILSLFTPYIMARFPKRKTILSVSCILYYILNIGGITILPELLHTESQRVTGLIIITLLTNVINWLILPAYHPWQMSLLTPDVRHTYQAYNSVVSNTASTLLLIVSSIVTDSLEGDTQRTVIIALRWTALAVAFLDVYFRSKPREPEYVTTNAQARITDIFRIPLSNPKFRLTMLVYFLYASIANLTNASESVWLLQEVKVSYLYINIVSAVYSLVILAISRYCNRFMQRKGTFRTLAFTLLLLAPTYLAFSFVNHGNFLWLMTFVRLAQHFVSVLLLISSGNLVYVNLPSKDQTCCISFYLFLSAFTGTVGMSIGTWIIASMGDSCWSFFGYPMGGVPTLQLLKFLLFILLAAFIMLLRKRLEPDRIR